MTSKGWINANTWHEPSAPSQIQLLLQKPEKQLILCSCVTKSLHLSFLPRGVVPYTVTATSRCVSQPKCSWRSSEKTVLTFNQVYHTLIKVLKEKTKPLDQVDFQSLALTITQASQHQPRREDDGTSAVILIRYRSFIFSPAGWGRFCRRPLETQTREFWRLPPRRGCAPGFGRAQLVLLQTPINFYTNTSSARIIAANLFEETKIKLVQLMLSKSA